MSLEITPLDNPNILLEINNSAVPDINALNDLKARWLVDHLVTPGLAVLEEQAAGVVVVLSDQCGYESEYYRWFTARYEGFLYIDRVVVAAWARGRGVAKKLYQEVEQVARERGLAVVADVYSEPPNIPSLNLHRAMGYQEVGTQYIAAEKKTASKFMKYAQQAKRKPQT